MADSARMNTVGFPGFAAAMFQHAVLMTLRRRRVVLAAGVVLLPVLLPILLKFLSDNAFAEDGNKVFVHLVENLYLKAMAPLLALFFGVMLIGEDVESQTIPYILTRPAPRSSIVLGRFAAYVLISAVLMIVSIALTFFACGALGNLPPVAANFRLLAHYEALAVAALVCYGGFAMLLGATLRHPIIVGILLIFGWQPLAMYIPGLVDFLTIEKFVECLLPVLATERQNEVVQTILGEFQKKEYMIGAGKAGITLAVLSVTFLLAACFAMRRKEYSNANAVGG